MRNDARTLGYLDALEANDDVIREAALQRHARQVRTALHEKPARRRTAVGVDRNQRHSGLRAHGLERIANLKGNRFERRPRHMSPIAVR